MGGFPYLSHWPVPVRLWCLLVAGYVAALGSPLPASLWDGARAAALLTGAGSLCAGLFQRRLAMRPAARCLEPVLGSAALLLCGAALAAEADRATWPLPVHPRPIDVEVVGCVRDASAADAASASVTFETRSVRVGDATRRCRALLLLRWPQDGPPPSWAAPGLLLRCRGSYHPPEDARNPGCEPPGRWLERAGVAGTLNVEGPSVALLAGTGGPGAADAIRYAVSRLCSRGLCAPVAALARGMVLGDRSGISAPVRDAFRDGGTIHILSISGLHVVAVAGMIAALALALRIPAGPAIWIEVGLLWGYVLLVGAPPSASRAAILWTATRCGRLLHRSVSAWTGWGIAGLILHLADPLAPLDPGFQLSFAAVLGLAAAAGMAPPAPRGEPAPGWRRSAARVARGTSSLLAQSAGAEAGTVGIQAALFGAIPAVGVVLNLVIVPLCGIFMAEIALYLAAAALCPCLADGAAGAADGTGIALLWLTEKATSLLQPWPVRAVAPPAALALALVPLLAAVGARSAARAGPGGGGRKVRVVPIAVAAVILGWLIPLGAASLPSAGLLSSILSAAHRTAARSSLPWIEMLDVGQGDATLVRFPGGRTLLVDAGPAGRGRDEGRYSVEPALRAEGVRRVDIALLSHAHRDHYGGLAWLARRGWLAQVFENGNDPRGDWRRDLFRGSGRLPADQIVVSDTTLDLGDGARLRLCRAPLPDPAEGAANARENNNSVVGVLTLGQHRVLFAGDIEAGAERALLGSLPPCDVLKVPHHGSKTSSEDSWLASVAPRIALVSCGERNRFGHPDRSTLGRYARRGIRVFRTDREGAIRLTMVSDAIWISTRAHPAPIRWAPSTGRP